MIYNLNNITKLKL